MAELLLKFLDPATHEDRTVRVDRDEFFIGRHPDCDLPISDSRLSREHLKISRYGDDFIAADRGSSNGTKLNYTPLDDPTQISNGDILDLGGLQITVEITYSTDAQPSPTQNEHAIDEPDQPEQAPAAIPAALAPPEPASGIPVAVLVIIPIFALFVIVLAGGFIYFLGGDSPKAAVNTRTASGLDDFDDFDRPAKAAPTPAAKPTASTGGSTNTVAIPPPGTDTTAASGENLSESAKVEKNGALFLRKIAQNEPKAFMTSEQATAVNAKIKQLSSSPALAANLESARKSSTQLTSLAASKNMKPQFLAIAAVTRLGSNRGDVAQTAQSILDVLNVLSLQIGSELAEDSLLVIAAYDQGAAGETMKMRNMLQNLSNQFPDSSRSIRSVFFLHKNQKITPADFDRALTFHAIGTIAQNPKDFGVNAEALGL
ncbi:MAG: FHA domain-containing protein [Blastocatellia bacterium]|nr:FHA domain-containing protein [Blastocatellia bacterium]